MTNTAVRIEAVSEYSEVIAKGIGAALWDEMMRWCDQKQVSLTFISKPSRQAAHQFYLSSSAVIRDTTVFKVDPKTT
jgi:hypothetical protein